MIAVVHIPTLAIAIRSFMGSLVPLCGWMNGRWIVFAAPLQQSYAKKRRPRVRSRAYPMLSSATLFNRGTPLSPHSQMADANDPTAPTLAHRIIAAVRSGAAISSKVFFAVVIAAVASPAPSAHAQDADTVTLNFVNADIDAVVKAVAEITGRNF